MFFFFYFRLHMQHAVSVYKIIPGAIVDHENMPLRAAQCRLAREIGHKVYELKPRTELGLWASKEYLMRNQCLGWRGSGKIWSESTCSPGRP